MKYLATLTHLFFVAPVSAQCTELFFHDFEGSPPAGVAETFAGLWHTTAACAPNPGCSTGAYLRYGDDVGCGSCGQIGWVDYTLAPISLPPSAPILLEFCSSYGAEGFCDFNCGQVSVNGVPVFEEIAANYPAWDRRIIDISEFAGQVVELEFSFGDADLFACAFEFGWGIDDIRIVTWYPNPIGSSYCTSNTNSSGTNATVSAYGSEAVADNDVLLATFRVPAQRFGYYLMSRSQDFVPLFGGSEGNLCLGSPIVRHNLSILRSSASGRLIYCMDLLNLPQNHVFVSGETWHFQSWFRDSSPGGGFSSNTSDGVSITWQ